MAKEYLPMGPMRDFPTNGNTPIFGGIYEYTGWQDESCSWKTTCAIGDWSFLPSLRFKGPEALKVFSDLSINSFAKFKIGQVKHVVQCNENGKIIAEGILIKMAEDEYIAQSWPAFWSDFNRKKRGYDCTAQPVELFNFQVQGPNSIYLLEKLTGQSLRDCKFMHYKKLRIKNIEVYALRMGMSGELGYELQGAKKNSVTVYNAVLEAGREFGLRRMGGRAITVNHLEACFPTIGTDYLPALADEGMEDFVSYLDTVVPGIVRSGFMKVGGSFQGDHIADWYRSPVELGWTKSIKFDHDFIGRQALEVEVAHPKRTMVSLDWNPEDVVDVYASLFRKESCDLIEIPREYYLRCSTDKVMNKDALVGLSTSVGYSAYFKKMISLCTIDIDQSAPGTEVTVVWGAPETFQKQIHATVAPAPYKKDNRRIDVTSLPHRLEAARGSSPKRT